jgi:hypothetical protein
MNDGSQTRRKFLKKSSWLAVGTAAALNSAPSESAVTAISKQTVAKAVLFGFGNQGRLVELFWFSD